MYRKILLLSCLGLTLASSLPALAGKSGYYRWIGADGEIHFGQKPPAGTPYEFIESQTGRRAPDSSDSSTEKESSETQPPATSMQILPPKDPVICERAQNNMLSLQAAGARIRATAKNGEVRYLSPEEIEVQKLRAQEAIDIHCN